MFHASSHQGAVLGRLLNLGNPGNRYCQFGMHTLFCVKLFFNFFFCFYFYFFLKQYYELLLGF